MNREKAINGLECCAEAKCEVCPYEEQCFGEEICTVSPMAKDMLELLKAQEPVVHARWKDNGNGTVSCSRCATWFQKEREPYLRFCGWCGAKMKEDE